MSWNVGDLIITHISYGPNHGIGYVLKLLEILNGGDVGLFENIAPNDSRIIEIPLSTNVGSFTKLEGLTSEDVQLARYNVKHNEYGTIIVPREDLPKIKKPELISFSILSKAFKYIPIKYDGCIGFYYKGKSIVRRKILTRRTFKDTGRTYLQFRDLSEAEVERKFNENILFTECKFRVKDYKKSGELFKFTNIKKEVVGKEVEVGKLELQVKVKGSEELQNTICVKIGESNYRFVLEDIEVIYSKEFDGACRSASSYTPPKDSIIKVGSNVKILKTTGLRQFNRGDQVLVADIKPVGNQTYIGFEHKVQVNNKERVEIVYDKIKKFKLV